MATVDVLDASGKKSGSRELPAELFEAPVNVPLMHQVVVAGLAAHPRRAPTRPRRAARSPAAAASRGARRAPAVPARARSARRTGSAAAWPTGRSPRPLDRGSTRRCARRALALRAHRRAAERQARRHRRPRASTSPRPSAPSSCSTRSSLEGKVLVVIAEPTTSVVEKSFRNLPERADRLRRAAWAPTTSCDADRVRLHQRRRSTRHGRGARGRRAETRPDAPRSDEAGEEVTRMKSPPRRHHPAGRVGEVLRGHRAQHVHVPRRPAREQDRDQGGDPADLERPGALGEHDQPQGQGQAPRVQPASGPTRSAPSSRSPRATPSRSSKTKGP